MTTIDGGANRSTIPAMSRVVIPIRPTTAANPLPEYFSAGAAGMDLAAALLEAVVLNPGEIRLIPCGFALAIPAGFEGQVRPRSGLASKHGITVLNAPGTIDSDYRGEVKALLINLGQAPFAIEPGMRIAQLVVAPVARIEWQPVDGLPESSRGAGGFGHTGA
jgi:dUTP pyrophosphatase